MTLEEMKRQFESLDPQQHLQYGISEPFSWRGSYDEVCFSVVPSVTVQECLERIEKALTGTFYGYKGGEFHYNLDTTVNFEPDTSSYSDQRYVRLKIAELKSDDFYRDDESELVQLMVGV